MNKTIIIVIAIIGLALVGIVVYTRNNQNSELSGSENQPQNDIQQAEVDSYTLAEVQSANTPENCWTAIRGKVYDLTSWIENHPGGEQGILRLCGTDGTAAFEGQHGGKQPQEETLTSYEIGILAN